MVELRDVTRSYRAGDTVVRALRGVSLRVEAGEMLAILGPSGSGKSTLMNLLGCLDRPDGGALLLNGRDVSTMDDDALAEVRNRDLGFVFQGFNLLARTSALENVALPLLYDRSGRARDPERRAAELLARVGLGDRLDHEPQQLSGGQQQRVAVARALVNDPALILADEPTGNLDSHTTLDILGLFQDLNDDGTTLIIVTHEDEVASCCKRAITLRDGEIVEDRAVAQRRVRA